jgi:hypothetical protein
VLLHKVVHKILDYTLEPSKASIRNTEAYKIFRLQITLSFNPSIDGGGNIRGDTKTLAAECAL